MGLDGWRLPTVALALLMLPAAAHATDIDVRVLGVDRRGGVIRATVCTKQMFLKPYCDYSGTSPARRGMVVVHIPGVPPGTYAVQVFHDVANNGKVAQNFLGIPTEGVGFSRDAVISFGPPLFSEAEIAVAGQLVTTDINLKFEP